MADEAQHKYPDTDFPDATDRAAKAILRLNSKHQGFRDFWHGLAPLEQVALLEEWSDAIRDEFGDWLG